MTKSVSALERIKTVSKNVAALVFARVAGAGLTFAMIVIIGRELGPAKMGIYTYAFAIYTIFMVIPDFGIGQISIRDMSKDHSKIRRYYSNIVAVRLLLGVGALFLLMSVNLISTVSSSPIVFGEKFWAVFALSFCLLLEPPLQNSLSENFVALERAGVIALVSLIMGVIKVSLSIYVVMAGFSNAVVLLMVIYILIIVYSIVHFYLAYRRVLKRDIAPATEAQDKALAETVAHAPDVSGEATFEALMGDYAYATLSEEAEPEAEAVIEKKKEARWSFSDFDLWRYLLKSSWPLAIVSAGVIVYAMLDIPFLSWIKGDAQVGLYSAGILYAKTCVYFTVAINIAVLPAVSKVSGKNPESLGEIWERMMHYLFLLTVPLAVIMPLVARPVLILQKHDFIDAWPVTWLTMGALVFTFMTAICFPFFIVLNKQKKLTILVVISIGIKLVLVAIAVPIWGYIGAAATVLATEVIVFFIACRALSPELDHRIHWFKLFRVPTISLACMYAGAFLPYWAFTSGSKFADSFRGALQYSVIIAAIVTVIFVVIILVSKAVTREGLNELNELLRVE